MFLDSARDKETLGQYSIIVSNPKLIVESKGNCVKINGKIIGHNPFDELRKLLRAYKQSYKSHLPFIGGFVGFLSYDLKAFIEKLEITVTDDIDMPDMYFGIYDGAVVYNHKEDTVYLTDANIDGNGQKRIDSLIEVIESTPNIIEVKKHATKAKIVSNFDKESYKASISKVRDYIKSGDIYQVNMTQRFESELRDKPFVLYQKLRELNPAPFASYIDFGTGHILSSSPERFIKVTDNIIEARPIKGTMPRSDDPVIDKKNKDILMSSQKDQSELLMIVDLERNDLSRVAKTGTVEVTELFKLESYATVHHLVATVKAEIDESNDIIDTLMATFPGGSITGAPKIRAMEVIDELEPTARALYTGSIGYIDFNQNSDFNIVIRTFICKNNHVYFQAGGGIVWDSDPELEYQESLDKAFALKKALNYGV
jgi:para-aminobenzoate synthetase component 1